jgi:tRNA A37 N6-isopentenylltransferase MiaA
MDEEPVTPKDKIRASGFGAHQAKRQQQELRRMWLEDPYYHERLRRDREVRDMASNDPQRLARASELKNKWAMMWEDNSFWRLEAVLELWECEEL